jgi:hypothetical protein
VLDHHVEHATGSKYKPMSDEDISKKFMDAGQALLSHDALSRIVDMTANLGAVKDVAELVELTTVRPDSITRKRQVVRIYYPSAAIELRG